MHTEAREHLVNLDKFEGHAAKEAYLAIVVAAERAGYVSTPGSKGTIRHTNFSRGRTNPYALIANKNDLLFYIRRPALKANPDLALGAKIHFPEHVVSNENSLGETRIKIANLDQAEKLGEWLFPSL